MHGTPRTQTSQDQENRCKKHAPDMNHTIDIATRRTRVTIAIFSFVALAETIWLFWKGDMTEINPFLFKSFPLPLQWFFKDLSTEIGRLIPAIVIYRAYRLNKPVRVCAIAYLVHCVVSLTLFFLCYNTWNYALVYSTILPVIALTWLFHENLYEPIKYWYYNGWKTGHYNYLKETKVKELQTVKP
jgi:hypothetical protein